MKKIVFISTLFLISLHNFAQTVAIPDANFKNYLLNNTSINKDGNGEIDETEAKSVLALEIDNKGIIDLTGIEAFTSLQRLNCIDNNLTKLDLSANVELQQLLCTNNKIEKLDLSPNTQLEKAYCDMNKLIELVIGEKEKLTNLNCNNNKSIADLDVSQVPNLSYLNCRGNSLETIDLSKNTNLSSLNIGNNPLIGLDVTKNLMLLQLGCDSTSLTALDIRLNASMQFVLCDHNVSLPFICISESKVNASAQWVKDESAYWSTTCETTTEINDIVLPKEKKIVGVYDVWGRDLVKVSQPGELLIIRYDDGTFEKTINR